MEQKYSKRNYQKKTPEEPLMGKVQPQAVEVEEAVLGALMLEKEAYSLVAAKPTFYAWERQPADRISVADLYEERIRGAIRLGVEGGRMTASALTEPLDKVLAKLNLLCDDGRPNNAAAMLFGTNLYGFNNSDIKEECKRTSELDNPRIEIY